MSAVATDRMRLFEFIEEKLEEQGYNLFRIIPPSFTIMEAPEDFGVFEIAARTCYKSEDKIDEGTDELLPVTCAHAEVGGFQQKRTALPGVDAAETVRFSWKVVEPQGQREHDVRVSR